MELVVSTVKVKSEESAKDVDPTVYWVGRGQNGATEALTSVGMRRATSVFVYETAMVVYSFPPTLSKPSTLRARQAAAEHTKSKMYPHDKRICQ